MKNYNIDIICLNTSNKLFYGDRPHSIDYNISIFSFIFCYNIIALAWYNDK